jgi:hypothetical protein
MGGCRQDQNTGGQLLMDHSFLPLLSFDCTTKLLLG